LLFPSHILPKRIPSPIFFFLPYIKEEELYLWRTARYIYIIKNLGPEKNKKQKLRADRGASF